MDKDGTGMILASELSAVMQKFEIGMEEEELAALIKEVDYYGNGKINYSDFLSATMNLRKYMTDQKL